MLSLEPSNTPSQKSFSYGKIVAACCATAVVGSAATLMLSKSSAPSSSSSLVQLPEEFSATWEVSDPESLDYAAKGAFRKFNDPVTGTWKIEGVYTDKLENGRENKKILKDDLYFKTVKNNGTYVPYKCDETPNYALLKHSFEDIVEVDSSQLRASLFEDMEKVCPQDSQYYALTFNSNTYTLCTGSTVNVKQINVFGENLIGKLTIDNGMKVSDEMPDVEDTINPRLCTRADTLRKVETIRIGRTEKHARGLAITNQFAFPWKTQSEAGGIPKQRGLQMQFEGEGKKARCKCSHGAFYEGEDSDRVYSSQGFYGPYEHGPYVNWLGNQHKKFLKVPAHVNDECSELSYLDVQTVHRGYADLTNAIKVQRFYLTTRDHDHGAATLSSTNFYDLLMDNHDIVWAVSMGGLMLFRLLNHGHLFKNVQTSIGLAGSPMEGSMSADHTERMCQKDQVTNYQWALASQSGNCLFPFFMGPSVAVWHTLTNKSHIEPPGGNHNDNGMNFNWHVIYGDTTRYDSGPDNVNFRVEDGNCTGDNWAYCLALKSPYAVTSTLCGNKPDGTDNGEWANALAMNLMARESPLDHVCIDYKDENCTWRGCDTSQWCRKWDHNLGSDGATNANFCLNTGGWDNGVRTAWSQFPWANHIELNCNHNDVSDPNAKICTWYVQMGIDHNIKEYKPGYSPLTGGPFNIVNPTKPSKPVLPIITPIGSGGVYDNGDKGGKGPYLPPKSSMELEEIYAGIYEEQMMAARKDEEKSDSKLTTTKSVSKVTTRK